MDRDSVMEQLSTLLLYVSSDAELYVIDCLTGTVQPRHWQIVDRYMVTIQYA